MSFINCAVLFINGLYLNSKIRDFNLTNSNHKKIIWKKTIENSRNNEDNDDSTMI